jgi:translation initiation factor eIF-2B subunit delta
MGNAIRWLKLEISKVDIDVPEAEAKEELCLAIDDFIRNKVTLADTVIAESAAANIRDGDVILTHAKSSIVEKAIVKAHNDGRKFRVIIVDSRPLHEGKALAKSLVALEGLEIKLIQMSGLSHSISEATKVLVGAHAMMSNGRLYSRCGTAQVAMEAYDHDVPVIVLCESIKFTEKVALDSIVMNEIAPPDELLLAGRDSVGGKTILNAWKEQKNLQLLNLLYDVTPAEYIKMVVTEFGTLPPSSVPVLHRLGNESQ